MHCLCFITFLSPWNLNLYSAVQFHASYPRELEDSHATCSLHIITLGCFGEMPDTFKHLLYHTSINNEGDSRHYMTEGITILRLQARSPNEPDWRYHCSCSYHSHLILFSFKQPQSPSVALILVLFKEKNKSTYFLPVSDENVCLSLLCAKSLTLVKLGCKNPLRASHLCEIL